MTAPRRLTLAAACLLACLPLAACDESGPSADGADADAEDAGDATPDGGGGATGGAIVFDPTRVATIELEVDADGLAILAADRDKPMGSDDFTYVPAAMRYDGAEVGTVGLRVKGNSSRTRAEGLATPYKLDLDRFADGLVLDGQKKLNLHLAGAGVSRSDATLSDTLSYGAWREHGVAASRTGWAEVRINGGAIGLYTVVEHVGGRLLGAFYADGDGALYKPEPPAGNLTYLGGTIDAYDGIDYESDDATDHAAFLAFVDAVNHEPVADWGATMDVDSVLTYFAGNVALGNWDTYSTMAHNYYLYEGDDGRIAMLPWDMNLSQGSVTGACPSDTGGRPGGGGGGPGGGDKPLHAILADPASMARYREILESLLDGAASPARLGERIDVAVAALGDRAPAGFDADRLRSTIASRVATIRAALPATTSCD